MIVVTNKEQMCRKRRNSQRKAHSTNINPLRRQQQADQGEKQQVVGLIPSSQLYGGNCLRLILAHSFPKSGNPKERYGLTSTTRQYSTLVSLRWGKGGIKTYGKRSVVAMFNEYKKLYNLDVLGLKTQQSCTARENIEHSEMLTLLKKSGAVKSKEESVQMGAANSHISRNKKRRHQPSYYKRYLNHY